MKVLHSLLLLGSILFSVSCSGPKDADIPGYITFLPPIIIDGRDTIQNQIKDVWVYHGQLYHGTFQTPAKIPILNRNERQILILPGVWANDGPLEKKIYPFLQRDTLIRGLSAKESITYRPVFRYYPFGTEIETPFKEDFEGNAINFVNLWPDADTALIKRSEVAYKGRYGGHIHFDSVRKTFAVASAGNPFKLFKQFNDVWAEVTYRGNLKFNIGIDPSNTTTPGFAPSSTEWRTVYFDLSRQFNALKDQKQEFRLYISAQTDGNSIRDLYFDNIRILQFRP
jgi:hypothetical protein